MHISRNSLRNLVFSPFPLISIPFDSSDKSALIGFLSISTRQRAASLNYEFLGIFHHSISFSQIRDSLMFKDRKNAYMHMLHRTIGIIIICAVFTQHIITVNVTPTYTQKSKILENLDVCGKSRRLRQIYTSNISPATFSLFDTGNSSYQRETIPY